MKYRHMKDYVYYYKRREMSLTCRLADLVSHWNYMIDYVIATKCLEW